MHRLREEQQEERARVREREREGKTMSFGFFCGRFKFSGYPPPPHLSMTLAFLGISKTERQGKPGNTMGSRVLVETPRGAQGTEIEICWRTHAHPHTQPHGTTSQVESAENASTWRRKKQNGKNTTTTQLNARQAWTTATLGGQHAGGGGGPERGRPPTVWLWLSWVLFSGQCVVLSAHFWRASESRH